MHELSKALPEDQRPLPLDKVQVNDNASFWLPNSGGTAGSTAAEGSCEAVRMACEQLVQIVLIPHLTVPLPEASGYTHWLGLGNQCRIGF